MTPNLDDREKEELSNNEFSYVHSAVRTPPPPGFSIDNKASFYGYNRAGAGSAPPRSLISDGIPLGNGYSSRLDDFDGHDHLRMMLRPSNNNNSDKGQISSFANLAAVLGEGLAESMGDSLGEKRDGLVNKMSRLPEEPEPVKLAKNGNHMNHSLGETNGVGIDNFARQSRHSLTHLVGSSNGLTGIDPQHLVGQMRPHEGTNGARDSSSLHHVTYTSYSSSNNTQINGNKVTVVEPGNTPSPAPHQIRMHLNQQDISRKAVHMNQSVSQIGRASAPPQFFDNSNSSHLYGTNSTVLRQQTATSLQQRAAELRGIQKQPDSSPAHTPIPSFSNAPSRYAINRPPSAAPHHNQETETQHELRSFMWSADTVESRNNFSSNFNSPSRALAIFGVSQLPVSEIRSTCEAFGSLLYFRSEFCSTRNTIFIAYHDLRSACHASNELKTYIQRIASSNLNEIDGINCKNALQVMYSVCLTASSEHDDSALLFSNVPYGIDTEKVSQLTSSFGAVRSVDLLPAGSGVPSTGASYVVCFYDIQDANHCILEMQSTMPWGPMVKITSQRRPDDERRRGQELLALTSNWRRGSRNSTQSSQNNIPSNIATSRRLSAASTPSTTSLSPNLQEESMKQHMNAVTVATESSTPPIQFPPPPTPQLVVGPDGQYSYVIVQPQTSPQYAQYAQPTGVLPPMPAAHQPHVMSAPQYVFDGQNYWLQHPPPPAREHSLPSGHVPAFHQMHGQNVTYPVMPMYPVANPNAHPPTDSSLSSGGSHSHNYVANITNGGVPEARKEKDTVKADNSNQRNVLDIDAVKQGWDVRSSLMIRNIPNKYTRSMLLSEFKECGHGPGKIDFFYLPIDFRNKCNRGYAFVNFVDYRDIISFHLAYNGKGWKTFKSDKICDITYARIQGKMSMLKRFQNSALMDKDPEYRPVVFNADGEICSPDDENNS